MVRGFRREAIIGLVAASLVAALSMFVYMLGAIPSYSTHSPSVPSSADQPQEPAQLVWEPTGDNTIERLGIGLTVHTYRIRWDAIRVLYSVYHVAPGSRAVPDSLAVVDDTGASYVALNEAILGNTLGVTAGMMIVEPYKGRGQTLTLVVNGMNVSDPEGKTQLVPGTWSLTFIKDHAPGAAVDYTEGGRVAGEVASAGGVTLAVAGPPGGSFIKLLIDRSGEQAALYGVISQEVVRPVSESEFRQVLASETGFSDYQPPPGFPSPKQ